MKIQKFLNLFFCMLLLTSGTALAQEGGDEGPEEGDDLDVTMTLLPENAATPAAMLKSIQLPDAVPADSPARENSDAGRNKDRRTAGLQKADDARARGQDFGQDMADQARDARESRVRGQAAPEDPGPPDNLPGRP